MTINNLVFAGGGIKSIAYVGALKSLENNNQLNNIINVAGTSGGAIIATLIAAGYNSDELIDAWTLVDVSRFKDHKIGFIRDIYRFIFKYGIYQGNYTYNWIRFLLEGKGIDPNISIKEFSKISKYNLHILTTNITTGESIVISKDNKELSDTPVALAVKMSSAIPIFYQSVKYKNNLYCDGGVLNNYPISLFDDENTIANTLGFQLKKKENTIKKHDNSNIIKYSINLITTIHNRLQEIHLNANNWNRTVSINCEKIKATDFELSQSDISFLINQGYKYTNDFFNSKFSND